MIYNTDIKGFLDLFGTKKLSIDVGGLKPLFLGGEFDGILDLLTGVVWQFLPNRALSAAKSVLKGVQNKLQTSIRNYKFFREGINDISFNQACTHSLLQKYIRLTC